MRNNTKRPSSWTVRSVPNQRGSVVFLSTFTCFFMTCTLYLIYLVSRLNVMLLPGFITSHTLRNLTYKLRNGTVEVKSKREEVKTHKNKFLPSVNLILVFSQAKLGFFQHFKRIAFECLKKRSIYAKLKIIRLNTLHNFHPKSQRYKLLRSFEKRYRIS